MQWIGRPRSAGQDNRPLSRQKERERARESSTVYPKQHESPSKCCGPLMCSHSHFMLPHANLTAGEYQLSSLGGHTSCTLIKLYFSPYCSRNRNTWGPYSSGRGFRTPLMSHGRRHRKHAPIPLLASKQASEQAHFLTLSMSVWLQQLTSMNPSPEIRRAVGWAEIWGA